MPAFEIGIIVRNRLSRPDLKNALQRVCGYIHSEGGVIRSMENLGERPLPMAVNKNNLKFHYGNYFFLKVYLQSTIKSTLFEKHYADMDILKYLIMNEVEEAPRPCLYRPCTFGEVVKPSYDRSLYKVNTIRHLKNKHVLK